MSSRSVSPKSKLFRTEWQIEHQSLGIGPLRRGELSKYGYHANADEDTRAEALDKAVQEYGALSVFRKLNALAVYNKNTSPNSAKIFKSDRDAIKNVYML